MGDEGADTLDGDAGNDILTGGEGNDIFRFDALGASNADTVLDFGGAGATVLDLIHLDDAVFGLLTPGGLDPENFVSGVGPTAVEADDYILYDTATGELFYDPDGSGGVSSPVKFAVIASDADGLAAADFVVI